MIKKYIPRLIVTIAMTTILFFQVVAFAYADGGTCTTSYGQPTTCVTETPPTPHVPVNAGLGDIDIRVLAGVAFVISGGLYAYTKKAQAHTS